MIIACLTYRPPYHVILIFFLEVAVSDPQLLSLHSCLRARSGLIIPSKVTKRSISSLQQFRHQRTSRSSGGPDVAACSTSFPIPGSRGRSRRRRCIIRHFGLLSGLIKLHTAIAIGNSEIAQRMKTGQATSGPVYFLANGTEYLLTTVI